MGRQTAPAFAALVQDFFTDYMVQQRALSLQTFASYRETFILMLGFAERRFGLAPNYVQLTDLSANSPMPMKAHPICI